MKLYMKKFISVVIAFIIVWAILTVIIWLVSVLTGRYDVSEWGYYLSSGFGLTLAGLLGPKISDYITAKFKKP